MAKQAITISPACRQQRQQLRQLLRARRRALPPWKRRLAARRLARRVKAHPLFCRARRIAAYLADSEEMSPAPLLRRTLQSRQLFLPTNRGGQRRFVPGHLRGCRRSRLRRTGITNPPGRGVQLRRLDLVLAPLVGFDARGYRLGRGGGFYDRCFAFRGRRQHKPALLGIAYSLQQAEEVPTAAWDVPLDAIATERGLRQFNRH